MKFTLSGYSDVSKFLSGKFSYYGQRLEVHLRKVLFFTILPSSTFHHLIRHRELSRLRRNSVFFSSIINQLIYLGRINVKN